MDKPVYLGLSILEISKIEMYEFWYQVTEIMYVKPKYGEKKICINITKDVEIRFNTSSYELVKPLLRVKN